MVRQTLGLQFGPKHNAHYFISRGGRAGRGSLQRIREKKGDLSPCRTGAHGKGDLTACVYFGGSPGKGVRSPFSGVE